ncbi:MAG: hypothetical protein HY295_00710 [Thaumarchaeota archaeon]|nr:hypothetical protein [Nitrososphaerota archaeon]
MTSRPDIAIHATTSSLHDAHYQIAQIVRNQISVISTCEELVYPVGNNIRLAKELDRLAKNYHVQVMAVGVNPGFVMDFMVLAFAGICTKIKQIRVERAVDISKRRESLQEKMCMGFSLRQFSRVKKNVGHVGLRESAMMICDSLNTRARLSTKTRPIIASRPIKTNNKIIKSGHLAGLEQRLVATRKKNRFLEMKLTMCAGVEDFDLVDIDGTPPIHVKTGGMHGDFATVGLLLNYIPTLLRAKPGLHTVRNLGLPR